MPNDRDTTTAPQNSGHGHVRPRTDGVKARCGGPGLCQTCAQEAAALAAAPSPVPAQEPGPWLIEHTDGQLEKTRDRERAYLARHLGHTVTPLNAAPVGQADPWPEDPTPEMLEALRTGSRKDYPSDELCRVRYVALRAAVGAVGGQAEDAARWQPIETAPKGTAVLLRDGEGNHSSGYWLQASYSGVGAWIWPYSYRNPTHWMPLPPPPTAQQAVQPQPGDAK